LSFIFYASATIKDRIPETDTSIAIGPICAVLIFSDALSRPVSAGEGAGIAETLISFLLEYHRFSIADPPFPERVVFSGPAKRALKLQNSPNWN
jgi:hypothetical protein